MARRIIVTEQVSEDAESIEFRYAFWADVPTARQSFYADAAFVSAVVGTYAPSTQELNALRNGSVVERSGSARFTKRNDDGSVRTGAQVLAAAKADLLSGHAVYQAEITARNNWVRYGTSYDPTTSTWTDRTIA